MLTLTALTDAEYLISSVALSIDEYYAGVGESPGVWAGRWAEALGLSGVVEAEELRALVEGRDPGTGEPLLAGNRERTVRAFDMTFSAPKSVSLLWAFAGEPVAEVVAAAHREAVAVALEFLEERAAAARVQAGGMRRRVGTEGWVVAGFGHRTSREGDPQLHTHCLVPNLVRRKTDGRYVAFDAGPLFDWCRAAGSVYQNQLQRSLSLRLGVAWGPDCHNTREMLGFSRAQLRAFSKRSAQIEAELEAKGALYESPALRMQATTRPRSPPGRERTTRSRQRSSRAAGLRRPPRSVWPQARGWRRQSAGRSRPGAPGWDEVCHLGRARKPGCAPGRPVSPRPTWSARLRRFRRPAQCGGGHHHGRAVPRLRVGGTADARCGGGAAPAGPVVDRRPPGDGGPYARPHGLANWPPRPGCHGAVLETAWPPPGLGEDQAAAVKVLAGEGGSLRAVLAPAGYGKTTMLHAAAQARAGDGRPIVAVATTARRWPSWPVPAWRQRRSLGCRLDLGSGPLATGTVVVLDEVSRPPPTSRNRPGRGRRLPVRVAMGPGRPPPVPARRRRRDRRPSRAPR